MNDIYYVYALCDPRKPFVNETLDIIYQPFYVGKGKGDRMYKHIYETTTTTPNPHKYNTIQSIIKAGLEVVCIKLKSNMFENDAYILEDSLISSLGRKIDGGLLTNIALNVRSPSSLPEVRKKNSDANKGRKQTQAHINARVIKNTGQKRTNEQKQRISDATTGLKRTQIGKENIRRAALNRSYEHNRNISKALRGRTLDNRHKEKISKALLGKSKPKSACPHCGKICAHNILKRFHLDNCKFKNL